MKSKIKTFGKYSIRLVGIAGFCSILWPSLAIALWRYNRKEDKLAWKSGQR